MKNNQELEDELLPEYDFGNMTGGVRGKYIKRYKNIETYKNGLDI